MSRRARRKEETLRRIEVEGWKLFSTQGYEATSTREIAEAADIGAGTLFNYFPGKRGLLLHLMQRRLQEATTTALTTMGGRSTEADVAHLFSALTDCYARERRLSRIFVKELLFTEGTERKGAADWAFGIVQETARLLQDGQKRGELDTLTDALSVAQQIFSAHYFGLVTWLGGTIPSKKAVEAQFATSLGLILRGLSQRAA